MRKPIGTSHQDIVDYWVKHQDECGLGVDWAEAHERCWRCAYKSKLERCHIVPHSRGGSEDPANLVLLCRRCHREAPNVADPRFMWIWLRATCVSFYDTYWSIRGAFEFEQMFGCRPFTNIGLDETQLQLAKEFLQEEMQNATIHFGEGHMNPSTIACIFARVEERLTGKLPELPGVQWGCNYAFKVMGLTTDSLEDPNNKAV
jgi:hypothetical protein